MDGTVHADMVWYRTPDALHLCVMADSGASSHTSQPGSVQVSNVRVPVRQGLPRGTEVIYRHPVEVTASDTGWTAAPVFAVLAGSSQQPFCASREELRELLAYARRQRRLMYVVPAGNVSDAPLWKGFVRTKSRRWLPLPFPRPQAVYNRIPLRNVERAAVSRRAKQRLASLGIPLFNPGYFNKATLYDWVRKSPFSGFLPDTSTTLRWNAFAELLRRHGAVYLKPAGGSIGQGIVRVQRLNHIFEVAALRSGESLRTTVPTLAEAWQRALDLRTSGRYVIQAAVRPIQWDGRPCDFRVLLQKRRGAWHVAGVGVRVAAPDSITTHVPNGGTIERVDRVLQRAFADEAAKVKEALESTAIELAAVIDSHCDGELGEMSMDLAIDESGRVWFLEANSKPMKFDEWDIRERSYAGVLAYLEELALRTP